MGTLNENEKCKRFYKKDNEKRPPFTHRYIQKEHIKEEESMAKNETERVSSKQRGRKKDMHMEKRETVRTEVCTE